jgi:7,8-dihydro-6-hydroxymethylpterin dimethyltransferase
MSPAIPSPIEPSPAAPPSPASQAARLASLAARMQRTGQWGPGQLAGRRWAMGCVSLEITQRCNLDCTLCYLSESAEALRDVPLQELFRRIDEIALQYGPDTDVQISGGDPTLRDKKELSQIVRHVRARGMRSSLFTNGILLTRSWLESLAADGLNDVAFHVDMTQQRPGYESESALNALRLRYIDMARGLPLSVIFNTTVFSANVHDVPELAQFFVRHNDVVRFASFQLGAATGRGTGPRRDSMAITAQSVGQAIGRGVGIALNFDALQSGHRSCNRYAMAWTIGSHAFDGLADSEFSAQVMRDTADVTLPRGQALEGAWAMANVVLRKSHLLVGFARLALRQLWRARGQWFRHGRVVPPVRKISFFIHSFMDACQLDADRLDACVFMAATSEGPMSMCAYNAERERLLRKPIMLANGETWQPLAVAPDARGEVRIPLKWLKGKPRETAMRQRAPEDVQTDPCDP